MWINLLLPLLSGHHWFREVVLNKFPFIGKIELLNHVTVAKEYTDYVSAEGLDFPNKYPDMTLKNLGFSNAGGLGNVKYPLWLSLPGPLWPGVVKTNRVLTKGQTEINWVHAKLIC